MKSLYLFAFVLLLSMPSVAQEVHLKGGLNHKAMNSTARQVQKPVAPNVTALPPVVARPTGQDSVDGSDMEASLRQIWTKYESMRMASGVEKSAIKTGAPKDVRVAPPQNTGGMGGLMQDYQRAKAGRGKVQSLKRTIPTGGLSN